MLNQQMMYFPSILSFGDYSHFFIKLLFGSLTPHQVLVNSVQNLEDWLHLSQFQVVGCCDSLQGLVGVEYSSE